MSFTLHSFEMPPGIDTGQGLAEQVEQLVASVRGAQGTRREAANLEHRCEILLAENEQLKLALASAKDQRDTMLADMSAKARSVDVLMRRLVAERTVAVERAQMLESQLAALQLRLAPSTLASATNATADFVTPVREAACQTDLAPVQTVPLPTPLRRGDVDHTPQRGHFVSPGLTPTHPATSDHITPRHDSVVVAMTPIGGSAASPWKHRRRVHDTPNSSVIGIQRSTDKENQLGKIAGFVARLACGPLLVSQLNVQASKDSVAVCVGGWWEWYPVDAVEPSALELVLRQIFELTEAASRAPSVVAATMFAAVFGARVEGPFRISCHQHLQLLVADGSSTTDAETRLVLGSDSAGNPALIAETAELSGATAVSVLRGTDDGAAGEWWTADVVADRLHNFYTVSIPSARRCGSHIREIRFPTRITTDRCATVALKLESRETDGLSSPNHSRPSVTFVANMAVAKPSEWGTGGDATGFTWEEEGLVVPIGPSTAHPHRLTFALRCPGGAANDQVVAAVFVDATRFRSVSLVDCSTGVPIEARCQVDGRDVMVGHISIGVGADTRSTTSVPTATAERAQNAEIQTDPVHWVSRGIVGSDDLTVAQSMRRTSEASRTLVDELRGIEHWLRMDGEIDRTFGTAEAEETQTDGRNNRGPRLGSAIAQCVEANLQCVADHLEAVASFGSAELASLATRIGLQLAADTWAQTLQIVMGNVTQKVDLAIDVVKQELLDVMATRKALNRLLDQHMRWVSATIAAVWDHRDAQFYALASAAAALRAGVSVADVAFIDDDAFAASSRAAFELAALTSSHAADRGFFVASTFAATATRFVRDVTALREIDESRIEELEVLSRRPLSSSVGISACPDRTSFMQRFVDRVVSEAQTAGATFTEARVTRELDCLRIANEKLSLGMSARLLAQSSAEDRANALAMELDAMGHKLTAADELAGELVRRLDTQLAANEAVQSQLFEAASEIARVRGAQYAIRDELAKESEGWRRERMELIQRIEELKERLKQTETAGGPPAGGAGRPRSSSIVSMLSVVPPSESAQSSAGNRAIPTYGKQPRLRAAGTGASPSAKRAIHAVENITLSPMAATQGALARRPH
jgi:predicted  nucleic acid-binding Zn-ribbon protein